MDKNWSNLFVKKFKNFFFSFKKKQAIPRTVLYDRKTGNNLVQWPVKEIEKLRLGSKNFENVTLDTGSIIPLHVGSATQVSLIWY